MPGRPRWARVQGSRPERRPFGRADLRAEHLPPPSTTRQRLSARPGGSSGSAHLRLAGIVLGIPSVTRRSGEALRRSRSFSYGRPIRPRGDTRRAERLHRVLDRPGRDALGGGLPHHRLPRLLGGRSDRGKPRKALASCPSGDARLHRGGPALGIALAPAGAPPSGASGRSAAQPMASRSRSISLVFSTSLRRTVIASIVARFSRPGSEPATRPDRYLSTTTHESAPRCAAARRLGSRPLRDRPTHTRARETAIGALRCSGGAGRLWRQKSRHRPRRSARSQGRSSSGSVEVISESRLRSPRTSGKVAASPVSGKDGSSRHDVRVAGFSVPGGGSRRVVGALDGLHGDAGVRWRHAGRGAARSPRPGWARVDRGQPGRCSSGRRGPRTSPRGDRNVGSRGERRRKRYRSCGRQRIV